MSESKDVSIESADKAVGKVVDQVIDKTVDIVNIVSDNTSDMIDKVSNARSRSGHSVERATMMFREGVSPSVIALQMSENSPKDTIYTAEKVLTLVELYDDCESGVALTAKQTRALIKDQKNKKSK